VNLHGPVRAPEAAGNGEAKLHISLVGWDEGHVLPALVSASVAEPKFAFRPEPVSSRLLRSLPHPDRTASAALLAFGPDGRLIMSGYPSGVVQVFDPSTGKEIRTIETPRGYRGALNYIQLSPDQKLLFVALDDSKFERLRDGEKKTFFRRYSGEIRIYDLNTGKQTGSLGVEPRRGVATMAISPDGAKIATMEFTSGRSEEFDHLRAMYLWDVPTRKAIKLRDGYGGAAFSPDGKTILIVVDDYEDKKEAIYAYSVATGKQFAKLENQHGLSGQLAFSRDGRMVATSVNDAEAKKPIVQLFDPAALQPGHALTADGLDENAYFSHITFSPDGQRLAAVAKATVYLWDVAGQKLLGSWPLEKTWRIRHVIFDPAGERLAVATFNIPPEMQNAREESFTPQDLPQPKVFLIDLKTKQVETIVCPHGWNGPVAFSPDGKLLAAGGAGATHIFDMKPK
jgi:WD40 repeat protein